MASSSDYDSFAFDNMSGVEDIDSFFDFSQGEFQPSPIQTRSPIGKMEGATPGTSLDPSSIMPTQQQGVQSQRQYNGPSREYGRFKQQTGFPAGAMANVSALNELPPAGPFGARYNMGGYNSGIDFNPFGEGSSSQAFLPVDAFDEFVDPSAIDAQPEAAPAPARLFPGVHSQQAQQREAQLQQQRQMVAREEQTSSLGGQPRQSSLTEKSDSPAPESNLARLARVDEEMDEDERLLASDEGKKLSSKERRQLRNKVSARAFRSRRKEYISQLEGDLAVKAQEVVDLKTRTRQLEEQNVQLQQLTRMLLQHPAFSQVMDDMSNDPNILAPAKAIQQQQSQLQSSNTSQQDSQSSNNGVYVGMSLMPENALNFSHLNLGTSANVSQNSSSGQQWPQQSFFQQQQVFAVTELPEGPSFEDLRLSRASEKPLVPELPSLDGKASPAVSQLASSTPAPVASCTDDTEDPAFDLYSTSYRPTRHSRQSSLTLTDAARLLENSLSGKVSVRFELVTVRPVEDLDDYFASAEALCSRLEQAASFLPKI